MVALTGGGTLPPPANANRQQSEWLELEPTMDFFISSDSALET